MNRVAIKPELLRWACERAGFDRADLEHKFPHLAEWETEATQPTLKQVEAFAKATYTPVGFLFLQAPPVEKIPIPDFRAMDNERIGHPSPDLLDTIYVCQQRQEWFRNYARSIGESPPAFVGSARVGDDVFRTAARIREELRFDLDARRQMPTWTDALRHFIEQADGLGILVMCNGVVHNNNYRHLDPQEFRGFSDKNLLSARPPVLSAARVMPARFAEARAEAEQVFGSKKAEREARDARQLFRTLESILGPRKTWRLPVLRELWSTIFAGAKRRRRSADHERSFFQLAGYCLRPGFGYPLDEWRGEQMFKVFEEGVVHHGEQPVWNEFWVMWRRASGGLNEAHQQQLWEYLKPHLARRIPVTIPSTIARPPGVQPEGLNEMVRTAASLEHLDAAEKSLLGNWIIERLTRRQDVSGPWVWALARLGARVPIYGSAHKAVPVEQAAGWVSLLLETGLESVENAAFTAAQLARLTGDRSRDLDEDVRARVIDALKRASAPERWLRMVTDVVELEAAEEAQALGDTLPMGLRLH